MGTNFICTVPKIERSVNKALGIACVTLDHCVPSTMQAYRTQHFDIHMLLLYACISM